MQIQFSKFQCEGNDYLAVETFSQRFHDPLTASLILTDRHFGVGSDVMLVVSPSEAADAKVEFFTADGSDTDTAGAGFRCAAKMLVDQQLVEKETLMLEYGDGTVQVQIDSMTPQKGVISVKTNRPPIEHLTEETLSVKILSEEKTVKVHTCRLDGKEYLFLWKEENFEEESGIEKINLAGLCAGLGKLHGKAGLPVLLGEVANSGALLKLRMWMPGVGELRCNELGATVLAGQALKLFPDAKKWTLALQGGQLMAERTDSGLAVTGSVLPVFDGITRI